MLLARAKMHGTCICQVQAAFALRVRRFTNLYAPKCKPCTQECESCLLNLPENATTRRPQDPVWNEVRVVRGNPGRMAERLTVLEKTLSCQESSQRLSTLGCGCGDHPAALPKHPMICSRSAGSGLHGSVGRFSGGYGGAPFGAAVSRGRPDRVGALRRSYRGRQAGDLRRKPRNRISIAPDHKGLSR